MHKYIVPDDLCNLYFKRNEDQTRKITVYNGSFRINNGKKHDVETEYDEYIEKIEANGWELVDYRSFLEAKARVEATIKANQ